MGRPRWTNRLTVEDCPFVLCATAFQRAGTFAGRAGDVSTVSWPTHDPRFRFGSIDCQLVEGGPTSLMIAIPRQWASQDVWVAGQAIPIESTRPHFGGQRFWFLCDCESRVGRLYLPLGQAPFRCRSGSNLTSGGAQENDHRE